MVKIRDAFNITGRGIVIVVDSFVKWVHGDELVIILEDRYLHYKLTGIESFTRMSGVNDDSTKNGFLLKPIDANFYLGLNSIEKKKYTTSLIGKEIIAKAELRNHKLNNLL
jgi:hypothetical protein